MRRVPAVLLTLFAFIASLVPSATGASAGPVISQVYAGGGNAGAAYANDFVELFNPGTSSVDLSGWTVQYATASGTTWQATPLSGAIGPGRYYLVQLASTAAVGAALPAPDATGTTNLAASGGKIALVRDANALACGVAAGSCSAVASVDDLVGYGSATDFEGSGAAGALTSTTAAVRDAVGCVDSNDNNADFTVVAPTPRNAATPAALCAGSPPAPGGGSQSVQVDADVQSALSISLERSSLSFGQVRSGTTPAALSEAVTVAGGPATGYSLSAHRTAFTPADLPLGLATTAPAGGQVGPGLTGGARAPLPVASASDLVVGTTSGPSAPAGDIWPATIGFTAPLPTVPAGHYTASVTFTVVAR
jgi:hypothetical protein